MLLLTISMYDLLQGVFRLSGRKVVSELAPAGDYYTAEAYHQQYLSRGGRFGQPQSAEKGCNDKIRCYG
jgi:peptide-methionine (S)-S-oxide reductase